MSRVGRENKTPHVRGSHPDYRVLLDVMFDAAHAGVKVIQDGADRRAELVWQTKRSSDYLTEIDTTSEQRIRDHLLNAFPHAHMLGEEGYQGESIGSGLWFVVDPLDGTTNFLHGVQEYAVSIAALEDGELVAGIVWNAARGDVYTATLGGGTWLNDVRVQVSQTTEPERALIATGFPYGGNASLERYAAQFIPVAQATAGIRRAGAAALDLANLACGRYDAFWELSLAPWDIAAGILMIREAGGVVTDLKGNDAQLGHDPIVAGNPTMHAWLLQTLQQAEATR
jgi:myo-inositol-1(or 4)-monophosphatase